MNTNGRRFVVVVTLFFVCHLTLAQEYSIRLNRNINLRSAPSLRGQIAETAPAGTILPVVGAAGRWLRIQRSGNEVWMADWVNYSRIEDVQSPTQASVVDNCCFVDRQCSSVQDWTDGYWAFQNRQCAAPTESQPASVERSSPNQPSVVDNCCFVNRRCSSDQEWADGYWAFQNSQCAAPGQPQANLSRVLRVVDGDTIDVMLNGQRTRIRYLQMNTPERNQPCYREAVQANVNLVGGRSVRLVADREDTDRYGRLLRYVYVDDVLVNRVLVAGGFAEVVLYPPNDMHYEEFRALEAEAAAAGRGCHPTGIFDDGSWSR